MLYLLCVYWYVCIFKNKAIYIASDICDEICKVIYIVLFVFL